MAKVQQVKYLMPKEAQDPIILKIDRPDHGGHVYRLLQRRAVGRGDLGLSDPRGAAAAVDRRRRRLGRHPGRPDLRDAAVARSGAHGGARHLADDVAAAIRANNFQSAPGQAKGYFTVTNVSTNTGLTDVEQFKRMIVKAKDGALVRLEDIATVELARAEHRRQRRVERRARRLHRRPGDADRQPADARQGRARAVAGARAQPAAVGEDEGRLRFDQVHPVLDRRGGEDAGRGGRDRRRGDLPVPRHRSARCSSRS